MTPLSSSANMRMRHFMKFCGNVSEIGERPPSETHPNFVPDIIVSLEHRQVVLYRDNETMSVH